MAVEAKDVIGWAVTGGLGLWNLYLTLRTRHDAKMRNAREAAQIWSLRSVTTTEIEGEYLFKLTLRDPDINRYRIISIQPVRPRGLSISPGEDWWQDGHHAGLRPAAFGTKWTINEDVSADEILLFDGRHQALNEANFHFFVSGTASWLFQRNKIDRLVVLVIIESISSSAESMRIKIKSEAIDWGGKAQGIKK